MGKADEFPVKERVFPESAKGDGHALILSAVKGGLGTVGGKVIGEQATGSGGKMGKGGNALLLCPKGEDIFHFGLGAEFH